VVDAIKAKGRVAAIVIGNASVASFDEGVLTLRFPRQGDVKGFQGSKYEDLLKQAIAAMFGINVVIRAVTGGGDAPGGPGRRPAPSPPAPPAPSGQPGTAWPGQPGGASPAGFAAPPPSSAPGGGEPPSGRSAAGGHAPPAAPASPPAGAAASGTGGGPRPFDDPVSADGDLPPLPPPPAPDDEEFDPDDEDMSGPVLTEVTGMALVQRELGGQVIAEFDD
jgi:DNA polymerase-3 subunit gamma/tau